MLTHNANAYLDYKFAVEPNMIMLTELADWQQLIGSS